ncbi:cysteine desulfurase NifS [Christensenellaceae bacterium OttesenSCG-928-L17]|nr:cysteine desulfurase NifS [Christensenellaceae bacterium OttesenSCG-928-L17]
MKVYLDNAATTAVKQEVVEAMLPYFTTHYGNPSSIHSFGQDALRGINKAREQVQKALNAKLPEEIFFTGSGTESDNTVLRGVALRYAKKGKHIITTAVEHHAISHTAEALEKELGVEVTFLPVDEYGRVSAAQVEAAIRPDTILVSIMFANNEIGTLMPIAEIGAVCHAHDVLFHTDAVQAVGHVAIDVQAMHIDFLSISAHKFHGPKGVGALYARKGAIFTPLLYGGGQEKGKRPSTENVAGIVGMGEAIALATANMQEASTYTRTLRDMLIAGISARIPEVRLNGHPTERLDNNVNFSIRYIEGESLLLMLDMNGIAGSSGSACTSGSLDPSHVLLAIGLPHETAHGSLRLSLSELNTKEEVDYVLDVLPKVVQRLREMSPLYNANKK